MATNDVYLRPDAGDGANGVRLRPDGPDSSTITGTLAWTGQNDTWSVASTLLVTGTIAVQSGSDTWAVSSGVRVSSSLTVQSGNDTWSLTGAARVSGTVAFLSQDDTWALVSTVTAGTIDGSLSWSSGNDSWAIAGNVVQTAMFSRGNYWFDEKHRKKRWEEEKEAEKERRETLISAFQGLPEQAKPEAVAIFAGSNAESVDWKPIAIDVEQFNAAIMRMAILKAQRQDEDDILELMEIGAL